MKKHNICLILFISLLFITSSSICAQAGLIKRPKITFGANLLYATPKGNFKDAYNFGIGGEVFGGVGLGSTFLIGSIGTTSYKAGSKNSAGTLTTVPVKVGLKKYFLLKKLFINGDLGAATVKVNSVSSSAFTGGFGGGVRLLGLEAALYYNTFKNHSAYSKTGFSNTAELKIGWNFSL